MSINHLEDSLWWSQQQHSTETIFMDPNHHRSLPPPPHHLDQHHPSSDSPPFTTTASYFLHHQHYHTHHHQSFLMPSSYHHNPSLPFNLNHEYNTTTTTTTTTNNPDTYHGDQVQEVVVVPPLEKEHLFEKPLTPSDVGKLNRLVIPKQHAERYFPLSGESGDKGLLLSFEDEVGKSWKFRYSYWNSSQSYVLTKGWSRYVKEKQLDAGDVVLFGRHRRDGERLFIGWRRRGEATATGGAGGDESCGGGGLWSRGVGYGYSSNSTTSLHAGV